MFSGSSAEASSNGIFWSMLTPVILSSATFLSRCPALPQICRIMSASTSLQRTSRYSLENASNKSLDNRLEVGSATMRKSTPASTRSLACLIQISIIRSSVEKILSDLLARCSMTCSIPRT